MGYNQMEPTTVLKKEALTQELFELFLMQSEHIGNLEYKEIEIDLYAHKTHKHLRAVKMYGLGTTAYILYTFEGNTALPITHMDMFIYDFKQCLMWEKSDNEATLH